MICPKCQASVADNAAFCPVCGEKITGPTAENEVRYCSVCGEKMKKETRFCGKCGTPVYAAVPYEVGSRTNEKPSTKGRVLAAYLVSIADAIITLIIRLSTQGYQRVLVNALRNKKVMGISSDVKPFLTFIPAVAAIVAVLLIVTDKKTPSQKKAVALIVNAALIALALLFIWLDIPYDLFNF